MQGNNEAALGFYMKAIDTLDRDRRSLHDEASRGTFAEDRINFYYAAVLQLLERRRFSDAFEVLERSRSRALADLIASRTLGLGRPSRAGVVRAVGAAPHADRRRAGAPVRVGQSA